ncbi:phBC6A51 family helix-turn-helix protein [Staphylococcus warneri]|uniref:phBC6A51 family helix-turn-helix protein n=1 Tax=Staphylococcus warneri TaxID=1292 RepID=UPI000D1D199B|nr:DNA-binding protein [Staphylococcus warneri]MBE9428133.1 DNA-binding protein [Staphylococcus epidermidis]MBC3134267.1 DNA-binding protein [Staphylococcus warneri]PTI20895.1 DNA-binding protein [Staphylococcus warneri]PTI26937.1 DNA-binding protein [Staphylococcus warneri]RIM99664.1 DNA-binding protein [Staphylococcus warneri]
MTNMLNNANFEDYLKLSEKQQEYIRLKNETKKTDKQIAKEISIDTTTISRWKRKEDFRVGLRGYQAEYLANTVPKAIQTMIDLLGAKSELVRFQASKDILDRTGYNPVDKQEVESSATVIFHDSTD